MTIQPELTAGTASVLARPRGLRTGLIVPSCLGDRGAELLWRAAAVPAVVGEDVPRQHFVPRSTGPGRRTPAGRGSRLTARNTSQASGTTSP